MITRIDEMVSAAQKQQKPSRLAVACAQDDAVLEAVFAAKEKGLIDPVLVGDKDSIVDNLNKLGYQYDTDLIIDEKDKAQACFVAASLIKLGKADLLMKGLCDTSLILKAVLNRDNELRTDKQISHVLLTEVEGFNKIFYITDSAMMIAPSLEDKVSICKNAVEVAHALGNDNPKVAVLAAVEKVNPKMQCTIDAAELKRMNEEGIITGCTVDGPFALDNAVSEEAARHKGIDSPVAGHADILLCPDIEAGNLLNKSMEYFAHCKKAGVIMGAKVPIVLTSRASSAQSKMNSIALGVLIASK